MHTQVNFKYKENYTGFVYIWFDKKRKWFCVGSHMGNLNDGYISSTGFILRAYKKRPKDFSRKILVYYHGNNAKELLEIEQKYLNMIKDEELCNKENIKRKTTKYYNMKKNASGISGKIASELRVKYWNSDKGNYHKEILREKFKKENISKGRPAWNKNKKCPSISEGRKNGKIPYIPTEKRSNTTKILWESGIYDSRPNLSLETKEKISNSLRGRNVEQNTKEKISNSLLGIKKSEDHRNNISEAAKIQSSILKECPWCGFVGSGPVMNRWHFSNCKLHASH
jgi:hypothetical protein